MSYSFIYNDRLGISLPEFEQPWEQYSKRDREQILYHWEQIRGTIPERIRELEQVIVRTQAELDEEEDFNAACRLNTLISDLASRINDLHLWFRINQEMEDGVQHH